MTTEPKEKTYSLAEIHEILRQNGSRITTQREYILDVFLRHNQSATHKHLSVEDIHRILRRDYDLQISLATVYRTVKTLYELGLLREIDLSEDHKHYELSPSNEHHHHHIVCLNCEHLTIEFSSEEVNRLAQEIAASYGITVKDVELKITGTCACCSQLQQKLSVE